MSEETYESEITCPKCGHEFECSYECFTLGSDTAEVECEECNAKLSVERIVTVDYQTKVVK